MVMVSDMGLPMHTHTFSYPHTLRANPRTRQHPQERLNDHSSGVANIVSIVLLVGIVVVVLGIVFVWVVDVLPKPDSDSSVLPDVTFSAVNSHEILREWNTSDEVAVVMVVEGSVKIKDIQVSISDGGQIDRPYEPLSVSMLGVVGDPWLWEEGETLSVREQNWNWDSPVCIIRITHRPTGTQLYQSILTVEPSVVDESGPMITQVLYKVNGSCPVVGGDITIVAVVTDLPVVANRSVTEVLINATELGHASNIAMASDDGTTGRDYDHDGREDPDLWGITLSVDVPLGTRTAWVAFITVDKGGYRGSHVEAVCIAQP